MMKGQNTLNKIIEFQLTYITTYLQTDRRTYTKKDLQQQQQKQQQQQHTEWIDINRPAYRMLFDRCNCFSCFTASPIVWNSQAKYGTRNTSTNKSYTTSYSPKAAWESNDLSKLMLGDLFTESDRNSGWVQLRLMLRVKIDAWCPCIFHYLFKWLRGRNNGRAERNNILLPGPAGIFMTKTMDVPSGIFFFPWAFSAAK